MKGTRLALVAAMVSIAIGSWSSIAEAVVYCGDRGPLERPQAREATREIVDTLALVGTPRAVILASMLHPDLDCPFPLVLPSTDRARALAPEDAFVQWFAAMRETTTDGTSDALLAMQRLEPDNGAVWIVTMHRAARNDDTAGVSEALANLASATRDNERFGELTAEWLGIFDRHPQLLDALVLADANKERQDRSSLALTYAISITAAVAIPAYQALINACGPSNPAFDARRQDDCLIAAARMAEHAPTLVSRAMGLVVLNQLGDARFAMAQRNWKYLQLASGDVYEQALSDPNQTRSLIKDWRETRSEVAVIERLLDRAGRPTLPPADWQEHGTQGLAAAAQQPAG